MLLSVLVLVPYMAHTASVNITGAAGVSSSSAGTCFDGSWWWLVVAGATGAGVSDVGLC